MRNTKKGIAGGDNLNSPEDVDWRKSLHNLKKSDRERNIRKKITENMQKERERWNKYISDLVQKTLEELENSDQKLSKIIRKAIHIARLRNDFENLYWLELEMTDLSDSNMYNILHIRDETIYKLELPEEDIKNLIEHYFRRYQGERRCPNIEVDDELIKFLDRGTLTQLVCQKSKNILKNLKNLFQ